MRISSMKFVPVLLCAFMAGCGGGGGGGGDATPVGTVVSLSTFKGVYTGAAAGTQFRFPALSGVDSEARKWSGSYAMVADGTTTFDDLSVSRRRTLVTLGIVGGSSSSATTTSYWRTSDGSAFKTVTDTGVVYSPTALTIFPASAKVGDSGTIPTITGSDGTTVEGVWALKPGAGGGSVLALTTVSKSGTTVVGTEVDNFYLDASGAPTRLGVTVTTSGITVNLSGDSQ